MSALTPEQAMLMAIEEGRKGAGFVSPNPLVGCVILTKDRSLLSSGFHARVGTDHAEAAALKKISGNKNLEGAHVYVTLEPCAHQGRTPSCARALAALPLGSVTYGLEDPNPLVAGKGAAIVREAGIPIERFPGLQNELEELAEIFLLNMRLKRPFVAVKTAGSLDGQIALEDGTSRWITGPEAREYGNELRGHYDAVLTGVGTLLTDDPRMDCRAEKFAGRPQRLVVLDPAGRCLPKLAQLKASQVRQRQELLIVTGSGRGGDLEVEMRAGEFDLDLVLAGVQKRGIHSLFVEAGGVTSSRFIKSGLMDRLYLFVAPKVIGHGRSWTSALRISSLGKAFAMENLRARNLGPDLLLTARKLY